MHIGTRTHVDGDWEETSRSIQAVKVDAATSEGDVGIVLRQQEGSGDLMLEITTLPDSNDLALIVIMDGVVMDFVPRRPHQD